MTEWFYARGGQQGGPVTLEQLTEFARRGELEAKDLVWNFTMKDWTPAGQVPGIFSVPTSPVIPVADPSNPYAAPQSTWIEPVLPPGAALQEIVHGSDPLDAVVCVKRGFELAKRNAGIVAIVFVVYCGLSFGIGMIQGVLDFATGFGQASIEYASGYSRSHSAGSWLVFALSRIIFQSFSIFMALGFARIGLNLVSGKEVSVGMLFGEGDKLLRALGASILLGLMVGIGMLFLIVPGVYLALRYGQCMMAIVDRDMGVMDAFSYSSSITTNNRMNLFVYWLLAMVICFAGMLACGLGLLVAIPIVWMGTVVAYRWMQYGRCASLDHPGTLTPMLLNPASP